MNSMTAALVLLVVCAAFIGQWLMNFVFRHTQWKLSRERKDSSRKNEAIQFIIELRRLHLFCNILYVSAFLTGVLAWGDGLGHFWSHALVISTIMLLMTAVKSMHDLSERGWDYSFAASENNYHRLSVGGGSHFTRYDDCP